MACPVASSSRIELVIPSNSKSRFTINPGDGMQVLNVDGEELATWDTKTGELQASARGAREFMRLLTPSQTRTAVDASSPLDVGITWDNESPFPYRMSSSHFLYLCRGRTLTARHSPLRSLAVIPCDAARFRPKIAPVQWPGTGQAGS